MRFILSESDSLLLETARKKDNLLQLTDLEISACSKPYENPFMKLTVDKLKKLDTDIQSAKESQKGEDLKAQFMSKDDFHTLNRNFEDLKSLMDSLIRSQNDQKLQMNKL